MERFRTMLVALDGSTSADAALHLAVTLVGPRGHIDVVHAIDRATVVAECVTPYGGSPEAALSALEADERAIFAQAGATLDAAGISFATTALDGHVVASIVSFAEARHVDAIAMGTHGRSGISRALLGNSAAGVIRAASVPVVIVSERAAERADRPLTSLVAAMDESPAALAAAKLAIDVAAAGPASNIVLVHAGEESADLTNALAAAGAYAATRGVPCEAIVLRGGAAVAIANAAAIHHADAIAIGARGTRSKPFGIGSIAEAVARTSTVPVIVVPEPAEAARERSGVRPLHCTSF